MELQALLQDTSVKLKQLGSHLDALSHDERVKQTRALARGSLATLFNLAAGTQLRPENFVPTDVAPYTPVHHIGTNNLPLGRAFEKVMYRLPDGSIGGRNAQTFEFVTGPGYFTVRQQAEGEVVMDYINLPQGTVPSWPRVRSNSCGLSFFVYRNMLDTMRGVSQHVTVGRAYRSGKPLPNYFVLVRA